MPKRTRSKSRRRTRKVFRRRRAVTKYRGRRTRSRKPRIERLWPLKALKCLTYVDTASPILSIGTGNRCTGNLYRVNDLQFLNQQVSTTQVVIPGMSEFNQMWQQYRVVACKARVKIMNNNIISPQPVYVGMSWFAYPQASITQADFNAYSFATIRKIGTGNPNWVEKMIRPYPMGVASFSMYRKFGQLVGNKTEFAGDIGWQANTNGYATPLTPSSPTYPIYLAVYACTFQDVSPGAGCFLPCEVKLDLYVRYNNRQIEAN